MKSVGVVFLLMVYLNGLCTADEGTSLLDFLNNMDDTKGCLRGHNDPTKIWHPANTDNLCTWFGVACNNKSSVIGLNLANCGLSGTLGTGIANLMSLRSLVLCRNSVTGKIPEDIGSLIELEWLNLSDNSLNGILPNTLSNLTKLNILVLSDNNITGNIPENLGNGILVDLDLSNNHLNGTLPNKLNMSRNGSINLSHNLLSGPVPEYWENDIIPLMYAVDLTFNKNLTGKCTILAC